MGKNGKLKEKQKWSHEKHQLDNARKLRGIYFIDPEDKEFKETIKNARKKLETPIAPAMPCKICKKNKNCVNGESNKVKSKLACILEASESTILRMGESRPTHHDKFIPMPQAIENSSSKSSSGQGMGKIGENFGVELDESQK